MSQFNHKSCHGESGKIGPIQVFFEKMQKQD